MKLDTQVIQVVLKLLERVQLKGSEVPAYNMVVAKLTELLDTVDTEDTEEEIT
jgi:hypothetical protein